MRQALHCFFTILGFLVGMVTLTSACVVAWLMVAANRIMPDSKWGNCWAYAVSRWLDNGGYLRIRMSDGIRLLKKFPVPHCQWVPDARQPGVFEQFVPVKRVLCDWFPVHAIYFRGHVTTEEELHGSA